MKIVKMSDVFLNLANFEEHSLLTLAPPRGHTLKLKALIMVSKVSWTSHLSYKLLWFSFERKFIRDKLHFSEKPRSSLGYLSFWHFSQLGKITIWWHMKWCQINRTLMVLTYIGYGNSDLFKSETTWFSSKNHFEWQQRVTENFKKQVQCNCVTVYSSLRNRRRAGNKRRAWKIWQKE